MKILQVCTYPTGGAAKAALLLHRQLLQNGIDSSILFMDLATEDKGAFCIKDNLWKGEYFIRKVATRIYPKFKLWGYPKTEELFSFPKAFYDITKHPVYQNADVVHFHWTPRLVDLPSFFQKNKKPVVWTLHDQCLLLGGSHWAIGFSALAFKKLTQAYRTLLEKALESNDVHFTAPSNWLYQQIKEDQVLGKSTSSLIPNGLNGDVFTIKNKIEARNRLKVPTNKKVILFVADHLDRTLKGMNSLLEVIQLIKESNEENIFLLIAGKGEITTQIPFPFLHTGFIKSEDKMADCYNAADVFVTPSLAENLPFTVLESLFCGTPVVAFRVGGIPDLVTHGVNGLFGKVGDCEEMKKNILSILNGKITFQQQKVRDSVVDQFNIIDKSQTFMALYKSCLKKANL